MELCVFSKKLKDLNFTELGEAMKSIEMPGVDLTVRGGGHVDPEEVRDKLPEAVEQLRAQGVKVSMISTNVTDIDAPTSRDVVETAAQHGIDFIKLGYFKYEGFGSIRKCVGEAKAKLKDIAAATKEAGIFAGCHNHSGRNLGAHLAHLREIMVDLDPDAVGVYFDPAHAFIEGMAGGWLAGLDDIADRIRMMAIKDMDINAEGHVRAVPMGEGVVRWTEAFTELNKIAGQIGPVSIHADLNLSTEEIVRLAASEKAAFEKEWNS